MKITFSKYQGTGNDFVMLDNLNQQYDALTIEQIRFLCDRRFGIGADGLIKINRNSTAEFEVDYYNSDGSKSFCGNGARCSVAFAETLGLDVSTTSFLGIDGIHRATKNQAEIALEMNDVSTIKRVEADYEIFTGSPHYIRFVDSIDSQDITEFGKKIRYSSVYKNEGINVNLVQVVNNNQLIVRTYERGVEAETLSCGTGVTACVLAFAYEKKLVGKHLIHVNVKGGKLDVSFVQESLGLFTEIRLIGPGEFVFSGEIDV